MVNLPLALLGGVLGVFLSGGVLTVASLVGFLTLFGIATRNGIMLVSHIRHLQQFDGVTDFGEAVSRGAMERLASSLRGGGDAPSLHADLGALLADPSVDAVYVATPNDRHAPVVACCAEAGKHVLCEKPMATTLDEARAMVIACERAGVTYATAFDQRFHAAHLRLRELVASGSWGSSPRLGSLRLLASGRLVER
ncbi:MAG: efflux RND transporter permease subunit, partial [Singulisphaera sp.]